MAVVSKALFYEKITEDLKCDLIHYWNRDCFSCQKFFLWKVIIGSLKFFLPIYVVKAILNYKKLRNKEFLRRLLLEELRSGIFGATFAELFLVSNCILSKICGRVYFYNVGLVSGLMAGLSHVVETRENQVLDSLIMFNQAVEAIFRNLDYFNVLKLTDKSQTVLFMLVSASLMHVLQNRTEKKKYLNFWFHTPDVFGQDKDDGSVPECSHKETCSEYSVEGFKKFYLLGYVFSIIKQIVPKLITIVKKPGTLAPILINKDNTKFALFIGSYIGLYRYIVCYLMRINSFDRKYFGALAGLISGSTFLISPNLQLLSVGMVTLLQNFFNDATESFKIRNKRSLEMVVFMFSLSLLMHNVFVNKETCPSYFINMINTCSGGLFQKLYDKVITQHFDLK